MPSNHPVTTPAAMERTERVAKAIELRKGGAQFEEIARVCGWNSRQAAFDAVSKALRRIVREPATELLALELERLDTLWGPQYESARAGDADAMAACLRIMERRAKLLGLDAAEKRELSGPGGSPLAAPTIYIGTEGAATPAPESVPTESPAS